MRQVMLVVLLACLVGPALADDRSDVAAVITRQHHRARNIRVAEGWGVCGVDYGPKGVDGAGMAILHKLEGHWRLLLGGGGVMEAQHLARVGVPPRLWSKLGYSNDAAEFLGAPLWSETGQRALTDQDLESLTFWELTLMRNEIFARHGRPFADPELRAYFRQRSWYRENASAGPTPLEQKNANFIFAYQKRHGKL